MVIFEQTLRELLTQTNLVGDRVFLYRGPQVPADKAVAPYIVFFPVAPVDPINRETQQGPLKLIERLYQVSVFDDSQSRALAIADSLRNYLDGFAGIFANVYIGHIFHVTQTIAWEADTRLVQVISEFRIMWRYLTYDPPAVPTRSTNRSSGVKRNEHARSNAPQHHAPAPAAAGSAEGNRN